MLEVLQDRIEQGFYPLGKRLPSERKLAAEFQVPQSQVHRKLRQLVDSGNALGLDIRIQREDIFNAMHSI